MRKNIFIKLVLLGALFFILISCEEKSKSKFVSVYLTKETQTKRVKVEGLRIMWEYGYDGKWVHDYNWNLVGNDWVSCAKDMRKNKDVIVINVAENTSKVQRKFVVKLEWGFQDENFMEIIQEGTN